MSFLSSLLLKTNFLAAAVGISFLIELGSLNGRAKLAPRPVSAIIHY